jgi:hypothetical protein
MSEIQVDTVSEKTAASGVTVDGVLIKDSGITIPSGGVLTLASGASMSPAKGKVLQVVSSMYKGSGSTTSNTMVSTGLEGTITPASTSNKILLHISFAMAGTGDTGAWVQLFRGGVVLSGSLADVQGSRLQGSTGIGYNAGDNNNSFNYLDSPLATVATTYKLMYAVSPGRPAGNTLYINLITTTDASHYNTSPATMILMEIEG